MGIGRGSCRQSVIVELYLGMVGRVAAAVLRPAGSDDGEDEEEYEEDEEEYESVKIKTFPFKPMSVDEAILQMNLLGHDFYVFKDAETLETCVVYKRKAGTYGLIEPEF